MKAVKLFTCFHFQLKYNYIVFFPFPGFLLCILKLWFFFLTLAVGVPPQYIKTTCSISSLLLDVSDFLPCVFIAAFLKFSMFLHLTQSSTSVFSSQSTLSAPSPPIPPPLLLFRYRLASHGYLLALVYPVAKRLCTSFSIKTE